MEGMTRGGRTDRDTGTVTGRGDPDQRRARRWFLPGAAAVLTTTVLAAAPALAQVPRGPTQNALAGSRVFGTKGCSECHSIRGVGGEVGPDLGRVAGGRSFFDLGSALWNHLPTMAATMEARGIEPARLNARETGNLIAFLFTIDYFDPRSDPERGERLFSTKRCVVCHQVEGVGGVIGPNLDYLTQYSSPIFVAAALWNHGPSMVERMRSLGIERPTFTSQELVDLIAYLETHARRTYEGQFHVLPGRVETGHRLFEEKNCLRCHGPPGGGGRVGPDLAARGAGESLTRLAALMWNKAPAMTAAMRRMAIEVPELTADEMADIVAYLYSLRYFEGAGIASRGARVVRTRGCLECHSLEGRGGDDAPDLAGARHLTSPAAVIAAMWNHISAAPDLPDPGGWPSLSPREMADVAAYLQSLAAGVR